MHSVDSDPKPVDVFQSVSRLILEGRIPGAAIRGFGEGPHCIKFFKNTCKSHICIPDNRLCIRDRNFKRHLSLLWDNGVPLCIEILLSSECPCSSEKCGSSDISPLPDPGCILLEQWTVSALVRRPHEAIPAGAGDGRSLLQVIRSFLHFSQLAAWLSLSKGESPKNVLFRITMPGEAFASKFTSTHDEHDFPVASVRNHLIKVSVKSMSRSEQVPMAFCSNPGCPARCWRAGSKVVETFVGQMEAGYSENRRRNEKSPPSPGEILDGVPVEEHLHQNHRVRSHCQVYGKHYCTEDGNEEEFAARKRRPTLGHISRRDLFTRSLGNRLKTIQLEDEHQQRNGIMDVSMSPGRFVDDVFGRGERESSPMGTTTDDESESSSRSSSSASQRPIPTLHEKIKFRKSLHSAASMVFHGKTGLPLTSSPAPLRRGQNRFDFDSSLLTPAGINSVIKKSHYPLRSSETSQLLGSFEESVLHGRIEPVSTVEGFTAEIGASGSFYPKHLETPVTVFFYTFCDNDKVSTPYLARKYAMTAHINVGRKGYLVPRKGTIQVTLFNPLRTVIKMFVVMYDFSDMPRNSRTFLRQRILYMPMGATGGEAEARKWLRYLIHLRFASSSSGKIYLHTDLRIIIFRKSDADTAQGFSTLPFELRSFTYTPENPKYSPRMTSNSFRSTLFEGKYGPKIRMSDKKESPLVKIPMDLTDGKEEYEDVEFEELPSPTRNEDMMMMGSWILEPNLGPIQQLEIC